MQFPWQTELLPKMLLVRIWALFIIACLVLLGCVIVPYKPASEEVISGNVQLPSVEMLATVGPRELIEEVSAAIRSEAAQIQIVDPIVFRDVAFPDGNWRISRLFMKRNGRRIFEESGVKYLVLLGKVVESSSEEYGDVLISIGFYGAATAKMEAKLSAKVIDLQNERPLYDISSKAVGTAGGLGLFYGLFIVPLSEASAIEGLGEKIAAAISSETVLDSVRIAVMAMEPMDADYTFAERLQSLKKQLNEGDDSRELKMELARLGYSEPLKTLANEGDRQAIIDLYLMTGISEPLYKLAERGDVEAKAIVEAKKEKELREKQLRAANIASQEKEVFSESGAIAMRKRAQMVGKTKEQERDNLRAKLLPRAERGDTNAQYELASYYYLSKEERWYWICHAAHGGHPEARFMMAANILTSVDADIAQDRQAALFWLLLAADAGFVQAIDAARELSVTMPEEEVMEVQNQLSGWAPDPASCGISEPTHED